ncbi:hypothetical protein ACLQ2R_03375 [Streptosporangium sp. DT93]|uniref:hypothetical protein n=1 Tax=Streptosporangium sp. DT93 TaxID=3393428 RepID=UPI003CEBD5CF
MSEVDARYYRQTTPAGRTATVRITPSSVTLSLLDHRPIVLTHPDAWAAWAALSDALGFPEAIPDWVGPPIEPTDIDGRPLPAAAPASRS